MASVRHIAREAEVSIASVSRVLNDDPKVGEATRRKVVRALNRTGYVRRVGKRAVAEGIALAFAGPSSVDSPFDQNLIIGIGQGIDRTAGSDGFGHDLLLINLPRSRRPGESPSQLFLRKGVKGALLRTTLEGRDLCLKLAAEGFPAVVVGARFGDESEAERRVSFIDADSRSPSREAVSHLIDLGHRRIAVTANVHDDTDHLDRIDGWREAHRAADLEPDESLVLRHGAGFESGRQVVRRLAAIPADRRPTALYVTDPMSAFGALRGALELGLRVPGDLSLIGFDDGNLRRLCYPPMAAVCQDAVGQGRQAVEMLRALMARRVRTSDDAPQDLDQGVAADPLRRVAPATFEVGATTGPPGLDGPDARP